MSLINDALRRADMEKRQQEAGAEAPGSPPLPAEPPAPPTGRRSPWVLLLGAAFLILVGLMAYGVWWGIGVARDKAGLAIESATAALDKADRKAQATADEAGGSTPIPPALPATTPTYPASAAEMIARAKAMAAEVKAKNEAAIKRFEQAHAEADLLEAAQPDGPTPSEQLASALMNVAGGFAAGFQRPVSRVSDPPETASDDREPADTTPPPTPQDPSDTPTVPPSAKPAATPDTGKPGPAPSPDEKQPAPKPAAKEPTKAPPAPPPAPIDTSRFKITSIMVGRDGSVAMVNGRPVREGDTIGGAKVIRITGRAVEIEVDGRRATVGM